MKIRRSLTLLLFSLAVLPLAAQPPPVLFGNAVPVPERLVPAHERLLAGEWDAARLLAQQEVPVLAGGFDTDPAPVAVALAILALGEAGAGDRETAFCHWNVAKSLYNRLNKADLTLYGEHGTFLREAQSPELSAEERQALEKAMKGRKRVTRPVFLESRRKLSYTDAARAANVEGKVIVESILEANGRISHVRTLQDLPYGLGVQAMEAICHWRFQPARIGRQPVKAYYELTVNFEIGPRSESQNP